MKFSARRQIYLIAPRSLFVIFAALGVLLYCIGAGWVVSLALPALCLAIACGFGIPWITPRHYFCLGSGRRIPLAEISAHYCFTAPAQNPINGVVELRRADGRRLRDIVLGNLPHSEREDVLMLLRCGCSSFTEARYAPTWWSRLGGHPAVRITHVMLNCLLLIAVGIGIKLIPFFLMPPDLVKETEELVDVSGFRLRRSHNCGAKAKAIGDALFRNAASCIMQGAGTPDQQYRLVRLAYEWYSRAAAIDLPVPGTSNSRSADFAIDSRETWAVELFRRLSSQSSLSAPEMAALIVCYRFARGTERNEQEARRLLRKINAAMP